MGLLGTLFALFILYLLVAGSVTLVLYTRIGQGTKGGFWYTDRDKLKKYIFKSWIDWAGRPATFSYAPSATVFYSTTYKALTGKNSVAECMFQCEAANERGKTPKCVGFVYQTSNTCTLMSTMDGLARGADLTSNVVYFIDGLDTARETKFYKSNTQPGVTLFDGSPYNTGGASIESTISCTANCASLSDCQGVILTNTGPNTNTMCALVKEGLDPAKFTLDNNSNIVYFKEHDPLNSSSLQYWASS